MRFNLKFWKLILKSYFEFTIATLSFTPVTWEHDKLIICHHSWNIDKYEENLDLALYRALPFFKFFMPRYNPPTPRIYCRFKTWNDPTKKLSSLMTSSSLSQLSMLVNIITCLLEAVESAITQYLHNSFKKKIIFFIRSIGIGVVMWWRDFPSEIYSIWLEGGGVHDTNQWW